MTRAVFVLAALAAAAAPAVSTPLPRHGLVVFSSQCVSEQSDDLYGMRITLRRIGDVDDAIVERADFATEVVWPVNVDSVHGVLSFTLHPGSSSSALVQGVLFEGGKTLTLTGLPDAPAGYREVLTRVTDFSRSTPRCGTR